MPRRVIIEHKDGREYSILSSDFDAKDAHADGKSYKDQGFRRVRWEDSGEPYEAPKKEA